MSLIDKPGGRSAVAARSASGSPARRRRSAKTVVRSVTDASLADGTITPSFKLPRLRAPRFAQRVFDIRNYGAADRDDATAAIAAAISACVNAGGGRVLIPAGEWKTGAIHLQSDVELHIAKGAVVRFSSDPTDYLPTVFVRWGGQECYNHSPFIYARDCKNIAVTGSGILMGQGDAWGAWHKNEARVHAKLNQMAIDGVPVEGRRFEGDECALRPQMILAIDCTGLLFEDFTIGQGGPCWTVHAAYCRDVIVRGLKIRADESPNNVGIVIDSCNTVMVEDCELHTGDDCIALKSGLNEDGWRVGKPTENVIVRRIKATAGHGGITIGSEMSGGIRNVLVRDCHFDGPSAGIRMKASRGRGGVVENVLVQDITMGRINGDAIQMTTEHSAFVQPDGKPPTFRNIQIRDVTCASADTAVRMVGLSDSPFRELTLANVTITARQGLHCSATNGLRLINVRITPLAGPVLSLKDSQRVVIDGLNSARGSNVFLDLRGRQIREICLKSDANQRVRPVVLLGIDVPKDAIVHE